MDVCPRACAGKRVEKLSVIVVVASVSTILLAALTPLLTRRLNDAGGQSGPPAVAGPTVTVDRFF